jgi:hypothetical protein
VTRCFAIFTYVLVVAAIVLAAVLVSSVVLVLVTTISPVCASVFMPKKQQGGKILKK